MECRKVVLGVCARFVVFPCMLVGCPHIGAELCMNIHVQVLAVDCAMLHLDSGINYGLSLYLISPTRNDVAMTLLVSWLY